MKFIYLGCEGAPETSTHYGVEFTVGVPAEVVDPLAIAKLSRHPHFALVGEAAEKAPSVVQETREDEPAGEPEADDDRAAIVQRAQALGIRVGRKGIETLKREIAEAEELANADDY